MEIALIWTFFKDSLLSKTEYEYSMQVKMAERREEANMPAALPMEMEGRLVKRRGERQQISNGWELSRKEEAQGTSSGVDSKQSIYEEYDQKRRTVRLKTEAFKAAWESSKEVEARLRERNEPVRVRHDKGPPEILRRAFAEMNAASDELDQAFQEAEV